MDRSTLPPHVLIFPLPVQGHVNSMLKLAELLLLAGLHVTFLVTHYNHGRLLRYTNIQSRFDRFPGFRFETISDSLPDEHPRSGDRVMEIFDSLKAKTRPLLKELLISDHFTTGTWRPLTCIIADGILGFALDVAEEIGIPVIYFRTVSACAFWAYFCIPELIEAGELPFTGDDLDVSIASVPGMEGFLRRRDLPSFCRAGDLADTNLQMVITETRQTPRAQALILNTFEDLEGPILSQIRTHCPKLYTIGPLHSHLKTRLATENTSPPTSSNSLWEEDRSCS
ncbi:hypothetical protein F0562_031665 [Nyssa sinensis]|uniref:Uncharacterized protein n=1 Tax=Nyssa sinensis TaxID=561372 RepID=A0A5J5AWJ8_9ASTE|nr:hypothetical protein F0562_031665 [Nyssa sinensis]